MIFLRFEMINTFKKSNLLMDQPVSTSLIKNPGFPIGKYSVNGLTGEQYPFCLVKAT